MFCLYCVEMDGDFNLVVYYVAWCFWLWFALVVCLVVWFCLWFGLLAVCL